jgi:hypothetical protein
VVEPFEIPKGLDRFESMDHGANHPTAWHLWAVDTDGNVLVADEYYSPGLVSQHAPEILRRRWEWWEAGEPWGTDPLLQWSNTCSDPSIFAEHGLSDRLGAPASVYSEYADHGIGLSPANNNRAAGYLCLCELLHIEPGRIPPRWASVPAGVGGAPRLYVSRTCKHLIEQFKSAPIAVDGSTSGRRLIRSGSPLTGIRRPAHATAP